MMRALRNWGGFLAVAVVCFMLASYVWTNNAGAYFSLDNADDYIIRGNAKGDRGQY